MDCTTGIEKLNQDFCWDKSFDAKELNLELNFSSDLQPGLPSWKARIKGQGRVGAPYTYVVPTMEFIVLSRDSWGCKKSINTHCKV